MIGLDQRRKEEIAKLINNEGLDQFDIGEALGQGAFGKVFLATHILTRERVAIKMMDLVAAKKEDEKNDIRVKREIDFLSKFHHNNIVQVYQVIKSNNIINIVQEYINGNELKKYIDDNKGLSEKEASSFFQQIVCSIEFIHKLRICHRDLKPENLLLTDKKQVKLIDFGLSNSYKKGEYLNTHCGSPIYAAPEMLDDKKYNPIMTDIWSIGIILYYMVTNRTPFEGNDAGEIFKQAKNGKISYPDNMSKDCKDMLKKLLTPDPKKRIKIQDIKKHPFYNLCGNVLKSNHPGLDITKYVIPVEESVLKIMMDMGYPEYRVREDVIRNMHNNCTTTYYLLLRKKSRRTPNIADLHSDLFEKYLEDPENDLEKYNYDINEVVKARVNKPENLAEDEDKNNQLDNVIDINEDIKEFAAEKTNTKPVVTTNDNVKDDNTDDNNIKKDNTDNNVIIIKKKENKKKEKKKKEKIMNIHFIKKFFFQRTRKK